MARLSRVTSKVFAENANINDIGQFGSLNTGTKVQTNDVATIQALSAWQDGWKTAGLGQNCYPTLQERNGLDFVQSYFLNYLLQEGIPEWDSGTTYYTGSIVKLINGTNVQLYQSLKDNNTAALSDTTSWLAYDYADRTLSNVTSLSNNIQTLLNAIYQAKITGSAGNSTTPCYMSSGSFYACSGLDSNMRCTSRTTISSTKPDVVTAQNLSGTSGYRVWASGFKECWGVVSLTRMTYRYEVTFSMGGYSFINIPIILTTADRDTTSIPQTEGMAVNYSALSAWSAALMERDKGYFKFVGVGPNYNMQWYAFGY